MNKLDLRDTVSLLANVGVIAGIIFLAVELRQNNELMRAEAEFNRVSLRIESYTLSVTEPDLAEILVKDRNHQPLTEVEAFRAQSYWTRVLRALEWTYSELPNDTSWVPGHRRNYESYPSYSSAWGGDSIRSGGRDIFDPSFVQFMEEHVIVDR